MASGSSSTSASASRAIQIPTQSPSSKGNNRHARQYQKMPDHDQPTGTHMSPPVSEQGSSWSSNSPLSASTTNTLPYQTGTLDDTHSSGSRSIPVNKTPLSSKGKDKARPSTSPPLTSLSRMIQPSSSPLSPSMLSSSSYKSVHLNSHSDSPDEPPRLITYTKHSQGFTWNDELFLPSYMIGRYGGRGRRRQYDTDFGDEESCPVAEIFVTDEEAEAMMP